MEGSKRGEIQQEVAGTCIECEIENIEFPEEAYTSSGNENQNGQLVNDIKTMLEKSKAPLSTECRINRVPHRLRIVNEEAYTPSVISIGPIHHCNETLRDTEKHKVAYLKSFIERNEAQTKVENLVSTIRGMEESIYNCYEESVSSSMHSDDFVKMILMDAIFILELFLRHDNKSWGIDDPIVENQWMFSVLMVDLLLLENQLPFFVLEKLFDLAFPDQYSNSSSLIHLTFKFFEYFNVQKMSSEDVKIEHFTDLIRTFQLPVLVSQPKGQVKVVKLLYSATQLYEAGVEFRVSQSNCLLDIEFDLEKGVLEMPCLHLDDQSETLIRNVMALEQFRYSENEYIRDYFIFLDFLIDTTKDISLLCKKRILVNYLGDNKAANRVVNNLNTNISWSGINSNYSRICEDLNEFYGKSCHKYMATLWHDYLNTPWRIASTIAAIILLLLTLVQTVTSIWQLVLSR